MVANPVAECPRSDIISFRQQVSIRCAAARSGDIFVIWLLTPQRGVPSVMQQFHRGGHVMDCFVDIVGQMRMGR